MSVAVLLSQATTECCTVVQPTTSEDMILRWGRVCLLLVGAAGEPTPGRNSKKGTIAPLRTSGSSKTGSDSSKEERKVENPLGLEEQNSTADESRKSRQKAEERDQDKGGDENADYYYY